MTASASGPGSESGPGAALALAVTVTAVTAVPVTVPPGQRHWQPVWQSDSDQQACHDGQAVPKKAADISSFPGKGTSSAEQSTNGGLYCASGYGFSNNGFLDVILTDI